MNIGDIIEAMKKLDGQSVEIGWFESNLYNNGVPVAYVAACNELGTPDAKYPIPARPFMRKAMGAANKTVGARIQTDVAAMLEGKLTAEQIMHRIGMHYETAIVTSIKGGGWQNNSDATIARKGFDSPLRDSGIMWQTVTHEILKRGG